MEARTPSAAGPVRAHEVLESLRPRGAGCRGRAEDVRTPGECKDVELRWKLDHGVADPEDVERVKDALGADMFAGVPLNLGD